MTAPTDVEIVILLDRSGSMEPIRHDTIEAINDFLREQREIEGRARLTLVLFDHVVETLYDAVPIDDVPNLRSRTYVPRGSTALLDAWGRTMAETEARLSGLDEEEQPDEVIFVVLTDGHENASTEWSSDRLFDAVSRRRVELGWRFLFLGANQDAIRTGKTYGLDRSTSVIWRASGEGSNTIIKHVSASIGRRRRGSLEQEWFTEDEREEQERVLRGKKKLLH